MPRPRTNAAPREIKVGVKKQQLGSRLDTYTQLAALLAAAGIENTPMYLREDKNGLGANVRLYCPDDPVEFWLDFSENLPDQVESAITQIWGHDTYREATAIVALGGGTEASDARRKIALRPRSEKGGEGA